MQRDQAWGRIEKTRFLAWEPFSRIHSQMGLLMQYFFAQVELSAFHILLHTYAPTYAELLFFLLRW